MNEPLAFATLILVGIFLLLALRKFNVLKTEINFFKWISLKFEGETGNTSSKPVDRSKPSPEHAQLLTTYVDFSKQPLSVEIQTRSFQILREVSNTGYWRVFLVQQPDETTYLLKQRPKQNLIPGLDYSKINLDPIRFAIPISVWEDKQSVYEALPYREGWSLAEIVQLNNGGIGGQLIESWTLELLELLNGLHTHVPPIIHRDLKPENILVTPGTLQLVLLDLASAVFFKPNSAYDSLGTIGYAPPEQVEKKPVPASDLYALAATLFRMNSGINPPTYFDRRRGKAKFYLAKVDTRVALFYPHIASVSVDERPDSAEAAIQRWRSCTPNTFKDTEILKSIKLPNGEEIPQTLSLGGGPTSVSV